jgi:hypothetical protein
MMGVMEMQKLRKNKKSQKIAAPKLDKIKQKQKSNLLASTQLKNVQVENYKTFFRYLISSHPDSELADEL